MNFGQNFAKSVRVTQKLKTEDKPYKLNVVPTLIDWIQRALVGACDVEEARKFGLPYESLNALIELNSARMFDSGTALRLRVSPSASMVIEEQLASKDNTVFNAKLRENMKLEWQVSRKSNQATEYIRVILKVLPKVLANYHKTCLQALKEQEIGRVGDLENDAKRYLELSYALGLNLTWRDSNDIDYLAYRSGMNLESIIAALDFSHQIREDVSLKLNDRTGVPHKCMRSGLFRDKDTNTFMLGSEQMNIKNDRDVSIRLMFRVFEERVNTRSIVNRNTFLDDDDADDELDNITDHNNNNNIANSTTGLTNNTSSIIHNSDNSLENGIHGTYSTANRPPASTSNKIKDEDSDA